MCRDGILVDPAKVVSILELPPPTLVMQLRSVIGHTCYYRKFIKGYAEITAPMEKLLKKDAKFQWTTAFQEILDKFKNTMAIVPIIVFPDWKKEFHMPVDVSSISLGIVLTQPGEGALDHPISFASRKLSTSERTT